MGTKSFCFYMLWTWLIQCIKSYKCIFMGSGFWKFGDPNKKSSISKIYGMTEVTPATIAYAVVQVCFFTHESFSTQSSLGTLCPVVMRGMGRHKWTIRLKGILWCYSRTFWERGRRVGCWHSNMVEWVHPVQRYFSYLYWFQTQHRQIFPDKLTNKSDHSGPSTDPNSAQSKARRARQERAANRQQMSCTQ